MSIAATIPNCRAYDPAFAYELAVIVDHGARAMMEEGKDEFYYVTAMNENYAQPSMPEGVEDDIIKGLYRVEALRAGRRRRLRPPARLGRDPAASARGRAPARSGLGRRVRSLERDQLLRACARRARGRASQPAASA